MKTMFLAIASMTLGTVLGFLVCGATARRLHRNTHGQRTALKARDDPKKMGVMDKVLVLEGVILVAYTVAALAVFWHIHPDGLRVRRVRPGKRCHGMDQDQQGQGGRGRQNERERIPARPGGTAHGPDRAAGCGHLRRLYQ